MNKRVLVIAAIICCMVQVGMSQSKIAFVNIDAALSNSERGKVVLNKTKEYEDSVKTVFDTKSKDLQTLFTSYQQKMSTGTDQEKADMEDKINTANEEVQYIRNNFNAIITTRRNKLLEPVAEFASQCIAEIGNQSGYDAIVDVQAILFNKTWIDATQAVTNCINTK